MEPKLLRATEVARILDVSPGRVYELIRRDLLPAVKLGRQVRVHRTSLASWMASGGQPLPDDSRRSDDAGWGETKDQVGRKYGEHRAT